MVKSIGLSLVLCILFVSCNTSEKKIDKLEIVKNYYKALDSSSGFEMKILLKDSLIIKEMDYNYQETFFRKNYISKWLRWDSVFKPSYKILDIKEENDIVKATISKNDTRINFLHKEPIVWTATIYFDADRISRIERKNINFNEKIWIKNRSILLNWIKEKHPELSGFLYNQTKDGGLKFLKAVLLFRQENKLP